MFKLNVISNLVGSFLLIFIPTISLPLYLKVLDEEKYGLFTLYFIIIIYFKILDFGFTATFNRYVALKKNSKEGNIFISQLLKNYEIIFLILSLFLVVLTLFSSNYFAKNWIISDELSIYSISHSLIIISFIVTLRFFYYII